MDDEAGQRPERGPVVHERPSWWARWRGPSLWAAAVLVTTGVLVGVNQSAPPGTTTTAADDRPTSAPPAVPVEPASGPPTTGPVLLYDLSTHCGIDEARIGDVYFEADDPLVGPGNPPADWAQPSQPGWMTLLGPDRAVFSDDRGHVVHFSARPGATGFKQICD